MWKCPVQLLNREAAIHTWPSSHFLASLSLCWTNPAIHPMGSLHFTAEPHSRQEDKQQEAAWSWRKGDGGHEDGECKPWSPGRRQAGRKIKDPVFFFTTYEPLGGVGGFRWVGRKERGREIINNHCFLSIYNLGLGLSSGPLIAIHISLNQLFKLTGPIWS